MIKLLRIMVLALALSLAACASSGNGGGSSNTDDQEDLLIRAIFDLDELLDNVERGVPEALLARAKGIVVFPTLYKAGLIGGAQIGRGVASVRYQGDGPWGPPAFVRLKGLSFGLQAGVKSMDLVLLVMTDRGVKNLFRKSASLGAEDFALAAGPVRKDIAVNPLIFENEKRAVYSYSYNTGAFAGTAFNGAVISPDHEANRGYYKRALKPSVILLSRSGESLPDQAKRFVRELNKLAPGKPPAAN